MRITDLKRVKTWDIANDESRQVKERTGSFNEPSFGLGWWIILNLTGEK